MYRVHTGSPAEAEKIFTSVTQAAPGYMLAYYNLGLALIRRGDWYYLFVSHGLCCRGVNSSYHIRVGRARQPNGPYRDQEGRDMMDGGGTLIEAGGPRWKGPGHQDVVGDLLVRSLLARDIPVVPVLVGLAAMPGTSKKFVA